MAEGSGGDGGVLRQLLAVFSFDVDEKELEKGKTGLQKFLGKVKEVAEGVAAAFAVEQVYSFAESQAAAMNAIERTSSMLGMSTERVQQYQFAAKSLGLDINSVTDSISRMQVAQQMAAQGGKEQAEAFKWVGASVKDANGHMKDSDTLFLDVADGISKITDPAKQAAAAQYIFGRSGRALLPFLKEGRKGVEEYFQVYRDLGGGYDKEAIEKGREFDKQAARTNLTLTALKNTIAKAVLPIVTAVSRAFEKTVKWLTEVTKHTHIVQAALIGFGTAALVFVAPLIAAAAPVLLLAAGIVALILALEDLYGFLTGKQSATGEILDKIFGKGAKTDILEEIRNDWYDISEAIKRGWEELQRYNAMIERAAVISRALLSGQNVNEALFKHEQEKSKQEELTQNQKDYFHRVQALKRGRIFKAEGETDAQAELAANIIRYQQPSLSPEYGPLPFIPGVSQPGNTNVEVNVNVPPGLNEKQVGEHVAKQVGEVMKHHRREAMATLPRAGN